jgi:protocatechuate 3,4-dioxygenase beta subunit
MKFIQLIAMAVLTAGLAACGGGGGCASGAVCTSGTPTASVTTTTTTTTTPTVTSTVTAVVSDFIVSLSKNTIKNDGADQAVLTVTTLDSSNNVVPGAQVSVRTNNSSVFQPPASPLTDATGKYTGVVTGGADKTDRVVNVTVTVNGVNKSVGLQIQGSKLALSVTPAVANPGDRVTITARVTDSNGSPIPGVMVALSGVVTTNAPTDINGNAIAVFNAPTSPGNYNVNAAGSGVQAVSAIVIGASVPSAVIPAGVTPSFAINPTVLAPNSVGSSANQASLRFLILDGTNTPIPNVRVRFEKFGAGLGYDGTVSTGTTTVITNASGIATSAYIAGSESSPTNGVIFRACYKATDFSGPVDCPNSIQANLTVAGSPVAISISDNDALEKGIGTYTQRFAVSVVDSAGRAVANAPVSFSVDITHYGKGQYASTPTVSLSPSLINQAIPDVITTPAAFGRRVLCPNEDTNRSNNLDPSEDINNSLGLEPAKSDVSIAPGAPGVITTNDNGILELKVTWLQKVATWMVYRVRVTTNVSGSESRAESSFPTYFVVGDDADAAPFKIPPYGTGACDEAN